MTSCLTRWYNFTGGRRKKMNLDPFCTMCTSTQGKDQKWAEAFCGALDQLFDDECFEDMRKVCFLFYGKGNGLSKAQYYRKRKYIIQLYGWLCDQQKVSRHFYEKVVSLKLEDVVSEDELSLYYFKDLPSLLAYIKLVGALLGMRERDDMLLVEAIAILSWYGVEISEMAELRKTDLCNTNITIRGERCRTVNVDVNSSELLKAFADAKSYRSFPAQRELSYKPSSFLFRSDRSSKSTENAIRCVLKRFNAEAKDSGKLLSVIALKKNGTYCEVLKQANDSDEAVNAIIKEIYGCDKFIAFGYAKFYRRWKERFYPTERNDFTQRR